MDYATVFVGVDTHSRKNECFALNPSTGEVARATLGADPSELVGWLSGLGMGSPVRVAYESGPTGFGLKRALDAAGFPCCVVAASKLARRNDGLKNDRSDAEWICRQLAAGAVRESWCPTPEQEGFRALVRARCGCAEDLRRARLKVTSALLYCGASGKPTKANWTKGFRRWARAVELPTAMHRAALDDLLDEVEHLEARLAAIEGRVRSALASMPADARRAHARATLLRGVGEVCGWVVVAECGDVRRFRSGADMASWAGAVPSEHSSGESRSTGPITGRGDARLRRALVEAAQQYCRPARDSLPGDDSVPLAVREHALKGSRRLAARMAHLRARGKAPNKCKLAVARELCGWIYHLVSMPD